MQTYISILRSINVGGQKKIKMDDLKTLFEGLKFKNVITYIRSGNVIFKPDSKESIQNLANKIEKAISKKFQFDVPVIIRTIDELKSVVAHNPFIKVKNMNTDKLHVTFLFSEQSPAKIESIKKLDYLPDKFIITGIEAYLYCPNGYGGTKLSNNFFENKLDVRATTRNWKTVNKLVELSSCFPQCSNLKIFKDYPV